MSSTPRFRLRFLLQEFDLNGPEVILGRSSDCHITIEDPLISRRHARVLISGSKASVEDLRSRNGVHVNGKKICELTPVQDGDRIRLGAQELVLSAVPLRKKQTRITGFLCMCESCGTPYPEESPQCPHCGATARLEEETTISSSNEPRRGWTWELSAQIVRRALAKGRTEEAERLLQRAAKRVDEQLAAGTLLDPEHAQELAGLAIGVLVAGGEPRWLEWAFTVYRAHGLWPDDESLELLLSFDYGAAPELAQSLREFVSWRKTSVPATRQDSIITRLDALAEAPPAD